jgi:signal transduction histidine kinase
MDITPFILLNIAASAIAMMLARMAWRRRRIPGGRSLAALMAAVAVWAAGAAAELWSTGVARKLLWAQLQNVGTVSVPVLFLLFALEYNRLKKWICLRSVVLLFLVPTAILLLAATNPRHGLVWSSLTSDPSGANLVVYGHGTWFWIGGVGYSYLLAAAGTLLLVHGAVRYHQVHRRQAAAVVAGAVIPWLASLIYNIGMIPLPGLDPTPMAFAFSGLICAFAIFRLGFLDLVPVARSLLVDTLEDGVVVLDIQNRLIDMNPAAGRFLGIAADSSCFGRTLGSIRSSRAEVVRYLTDSPQRHFEVLQPGICLEVTISPLEEGPDLAYGRLVLLRDITARKRSERERLEMERKLLQSQKMESIGVLAGGIAHDFNNLLMVIQGSLELTLLDLPPESVLRSFLDRAARAADRAADLTRQILDYSGRGRTVLADLDVSRIVAEKAELIRASIPKTVSLELDLAAVLPRIRADAAQIKQLVVNLIINAAEAIDGKTGVISVGTGAGDCDQAGLKQNLTGEALAPGRFVFLRVSDNGCGMDAETRQRLFDPFFTTKATGRGLGMSAVLGIVRGCKGALFLDTDPGRGTTVRILFPVPETEHAVGAAAEDAQTALAAGGPPNRGPGLLLVVDDEDMVSKP